MQFAQEADATAYVIRAYSAGEVVITEPLTSELILDAAQSSNRRPLLNRRTLVRSAVVTPKLLIDDWRPQQPNELSIQDVTVLAELEPEVLLIGTGRALTWPDHALLAPLRNKAIGFEIMDTAAACRTYNILMFEGRRVAAALMMI